MPDRGACEKAYSMRRASCAGLPSLMRWARKLSAQGMQSLKSWNAVCPPTGRQRYAKLFLNAFLAQDTAKSRRAEPGRSHLSERLTWVSGKSRGKKGRPSSVAAHRHSRCPAGLAPAKASASQRGGTQRGGSTSDQPARAGRQALCIHWPTAGCQALHLPRIHVPKHAASVAFPAGLCSKTCSSPALTPAPSLPPLTRQAAGCRRVMADKQHAGVSPCLLQLPTAAAAAGALSRRCRCTCCHGPWAALHPLECCRQRGAGAGAGSACWQPRAAAIPLIKG